jgi:uncharacterized protein (DUF1778 family)
MTTVDRTGLPSARASKSERIDLRVTPAQKRLLESAAAAEEITLTEFVLQSASVAARRALADRTQFVLPADRWEAFVALLDREPRYDATLAALLLRPSVLDPG